MDKITRGICLLFCLCIGSLGHVAAQTKAATPALTGGPVTDGLQLCALFKYPYYSAEQPVILDVQLRNKSNKELYFAEIGPTIGEMQIDIKDSSGQPVPLTAYGRKLYYNAVQPRLLLGGWSDISVFAAPGDQAVYHFWLNRVFDLTLPGTYTVTVHKNIASADGSKSVLLTSNTVKLGISYSYEPPYSEDTRPDQHPPKENNDVAPGQFQLKF